MAKKASPEQQARIDLAPDVVGRQRQRDAALELLEGFDSDGHDS